LNFLWLSEINSENHKQNKDIENLKKIVNLQDRIRELKENSDRSVKEERSLNEKEQELKKIKDEIEERERIKNETFWEWWNKKTSGEKALGVGLVFVFFLVFTYLIRIVFSAPRRY